MESLNRMHNVSDHMIQAAVGTRTQESLGLGPTAKCFYKTCCNIAVAYSDQQNPGTDFRRQEMIFFPFSRFCPSVFHWKSG